MAGQQKKAGVRVRAPEPSDPFGLLAGLGPTDLDAALAALQARPGAGGPRVAAGGPARTPETCPHCAAPMRCGPSNLEYICSGCGLIAEGDTAEPDGDDAPRAPPAAGQLRLVGAHSSHLQPDLYRSGGGCTAAVQKRQVFEEYKIYRLLYVEEGGRAFPLNACELAAELYHAVQKAYVKRSLNKKTIMAACLQRACYLTGYAPSRAEVADFMQLPSKGIARGENFLRGLVADGKMDLEVNADPSRAEIATLFALLGLEGGQHAGLREAVYDVVQTAIRSNIGTSSVLRSKVAAATYAVLCRRRGVPPPSLQEFCRGRIRKNTCSRMLGELAGYHSFFEECYRRAGLDPAPRPGAC
jgi:hypothetical protein